MQVSLVIKYYNVDINLPHKFALVDAERLFINSPRVFQYLINMSLNFQFPISQLMSSALSSRLVRKMTEIKVKLILALLLPGRIRRHYLQPDASSNCCFTAEGNKSLPVFPAEIHFKLSQLQVLAGIESVVALETLQEEVLLVQTQEGGH